MADRQNGLLFDLATILLYVERCINGKGIDRKHRRIRKAIEILKECGAEGWVTKYEEEMAMLK